MAEIKKQIAILEKKENDRQAKSVTKESYNKRLKILKNGLEEGNSLA